MRSHDAPGPTAGVLYQFERLLYQLASATAAAAIGIEAGDDLVVKTPEGIALEQDKHSLQPRGNPVSNRSVSLWKTLANWVEASRLTAYSEAKLYLVTNRPVPDCLAKRLSNSESDDDARAALLELRTIAANPSESIEPFTSRVLAATPDELVSLIKRIELLDASRGSSSLTLRRRTADLLHIPTHLDAPQILDRLLGWVHSVVMGKWENGEPAWITRESFDNQLYSTLKHIDQRRFLERAEQLIPISGEERDKARLNHFVEHLALVACSDEDVDSAIDNFIRFNTEYSRLLEEGEIHPCDWDDRGNRLKRRWEMIKRRRQNSRQSGASEELGRDIYYEVIDHRESLSQFETREYYLTSGHYQRLANYDLVWWHPDFPYLARKRAS